MFDPLMSLYHGGSSPGQGHCRDETTAIASVDVDWRETDTPQVFRADLPGYSFSSVYSIHKYISNMSGMLEAKVKMATCKTLAPNA
ncbi:hypothetical protein FNV43_RR12523 [Rhamnella rubrinervis]|uniref:Uncharacterized protein n=1 Tax=Rhamnella rubrinervis TaxID=2594499 RepID=A0A8K0MIQ2_9ROSA|nr:hypothetical protein FNV43_RR12523 [Rhamnella rubrinervis]